jgi:hypothetical protein
MPVRLLDLWHRLATLIKRKAVKPKVKKPETAAQRAARAANGRKAAAAAKAKKKHTAPAPKSGTVARPRKAASPKPATQAA